MPNRKERRAARTSKRALPPAYYALIETLAKLIVKWTREQPQRPQLDWHAPDEGTVITGSLDVAAKYLANSPDAYRLLAWLDEQTNRQASLYQVTWALRIVRLLPMPDGSYYGVEKRYESPAMRNCMALGKGDKDHRFEATACGGCGAKLDTATADSGRAPEAGDATVCIRCHRVSFFTEDMRLELATAEQLAALPKEKLEELEEMQALLRQSRMGSQKDRAEA